MKFLLYLLLICISSAANGQNLVPNNSFEEYEDCPLVMSSIVAPTEGPSTVSDWYRPTLGSSDYFNACAAAWYPTTVPGTVVGYQTARTGTAFAGLYGNISLDWGPYYREYIEAELSMPLTAGHRYYTSYWISLADWDSMYAFSGVDQMGAFFTSDYIDDPFYTDVLFEIPQVVSPEGYTYINNGYWEKVSGIFTASGTEKWIILGNFTPGELLTEDTVYGSESPLTYYWVEDVCVFDLDGLPLETTAIDTSICGEEQLTLNARTGLHDYTWNTGSRDSVISVNEPGIYWVTSVDANNCGFYIDTFKVITRQGTAELNLGNDTIICNDQPLLLNALNPLFESYLWNTGDTSYTILISEPGIYYATGYSPCYTGSDTIMVSYPEKPILNLPGDTVLCKGIPLYIGTNGTYSKYAWNTGAEVCCITVQEDGIYELTVSNICGEKASDGIQVTYSACDNCMMVPNAFSPNDDGINDKFSIIVNCPLKNYRLNIFNRWGQLVFTSANPADAWDGMIDNMPADIGTYFYQAEATSLIKEMGTISKKGDVILMR